MGPDASGRTAPTVRQVTPIMAACVVIAALACATPQPTPTQAPPTAAPLPTPVRVPTPAPVDRPLREFDLNSTHTIGWIGFSIMYAEGWLAETTPGRHATHKRGRGRPRVAVFGTAAFQWPADHVGRNPYEIRPWVDQFKPWADRSDEASGRAMGVPVQRRTRGSSSLRRASRASQRSASWWRRSRLPDRCHREREGLLLLRRRAFSPNPPKDRDGRREDSGRG